MTLIVRKLSRNIARRAEIFRHRIFLRALFAASLIFAALIPSAALAAPNATDPCRVVVVGYTGGLETPNLSYSGVRRILHRVEGLDYPGLCARTFSAYRFWEAGDWVRSQFGATGDVPLSPQQIAQGPKVILYGHSLGGWATVWLARTLAHDGVPIELTVQVDSVGVTDKTVPPNVKEAANYFERDTFLPHGRGSIRVHDDKKTKLLGNFEVPGAVHYNIARAPEISDLIVNTVQAIYEDP